MTDSSSVIRRPPPARPQPARAGGAIIAAAVLVLLAAACGGSPSSAGSGGSSNAHGSGNSQQGLAYSRCMRSHGVPRFPDASSGNALPDGLPKVDPQQLGVSGPQYRAAQGGCAHLLPGSGGTPQAESQRDLRAMLGFARCMRSHGVPGWPDPTNGSAGWGFNLLHVNGFDPNSPQIDQKMTGCGRSLPSGVGVPLARPGRPG